MVENVRARLNSWRPGRPWVEYATTDTIRHLAAAIGDDNPLWLDAEYARTTRYGGIVAPPLFTYASHSSDRSVGFPGIFALHAYDEWFFHSAVRVGDRMTAQVALVALEEKPSRWGGQAYHQILQARCTNQRGELLTVYNMMLVRAERSAAREGKKYAGYAPHRYSDDELERIGADYDAEERRGATPRYWEDVQVGDSVGHVVKGPLTVTDIICWWMGVGAPYLYAFRNRHLRLKARPGLALIDPDTNIRHVPEIAHFDEKYALRSGVGAPYDVGRQRTAWFTHLLTNWAGDDGWVRWIKVRYERPNYVGDTTWCRGRVVDKTRQDREYLVRAELWADTQRDVRHTTAEALVALPTRDQGEIDRRIEAKVLW
jgi:acyl dehydratase